MAPHSHVGLCALLLLALGTQAAQVTPMQKVITLLKDLSVKVATEGKKEAEQYDKYACFCKEQADEKLYSIEKSDDKISSLNAEIKELDSAIAELNSEVATLSKSISGLETSIKTKTDKRDADHAKYLVKAKDMNEAIDACASAIEALKNSKGAMKGAKLGGAALMQAIAALQLKAASLQPLMTVAPGTLALLSDLRKGAPKYQYQSNDIIATVEGLQATFKAMKQSLDEEEFNINASFD
jgi:predicted RNase H-like nuclease (RuvC/YqgF family)